MVHCHRRVLAGHGGQVEKKSRESYAAYKRWSLTAQKSLKEQKKSIKSLQVKVARESNTWYGGGACYRKSDQENVSGWSSLQTPSRSLLTGSFSPHVRF